MPIYDFADTSTAEQIAGGPRRYLAEGDFLVRVTRVEDVTSSKGTPGARLVVNVVRAIRLLNEADAAYDYTGAEGNATFWLTPAAAPYVKRDLETFGVDTSKPVDFNRALVGKRAIAIARLKDSNKIDPETGAVKKYVEIIAWNAAPDDKAGDPLAPTAPAAKAPQVDDIPF